MLTSNGKRNAALTALLLGTVVLTGCKQDPIDSSIKRIRLGELQVAFITTLSNTSDFEFNARIRAYDTRDSVFNAPGIGQFKHFISFRDTATTDSVRLFYTLPLNLTMRIDSSKRFTLIYRKIESRFALLLKTKNDSLVCALGTLLPNEWVFVLNRAGNQGFRVEVGDYLYLSRNTDCGREGDFDMRFANSSGQIRIAPAHGGFLPSAEKTYVLYNVVNTQLIKDLGRCPDFKPEFAFMIVQQ